MDRSTFNGRLKFHAALLGLLIFLLQSCSAGLKATIAGKPQSANPSTQTLRSPLPGPSPIIPVVEGVATSASNVPIAPPWLAVAPEEAIGDELPSSDLPVTQLSQPTLSFGPLAVSGTGTGIYRITIEAIEMDTSLTTQASGRNFVYEVVQQAMQNGSFKIPAPLADGPWRAQISEKISDGTYTQPQATDFEVDAEPPAPFTIDETVPGRKSSLAIQLSWSAAKGASHYLAAIFSGGESTACQGSPLRRARGSSRSWSLSDLPEGTYRVCVVAGDRSGRQTGATMQESVFVVDRTPPTLTIVPAGTQRMNARLWPVQFIATFSELPSLITLTDSDFFQAGTASNIEWAIEATTDPLVFNLKAISGSFSEGQSIRPMIPAESFTDLTGIQNVVDFSASQAVFMDVTPPSAPTGFSAAPGDGQISLTWTKGTGSTQTVVVRRKDVSVGWSPTPGIEYSSGDALTNGHQIVFSGTDSSSLAIGLANEAPYHFAAFAVDDAGNYSSATVISATPTKPGRWVVGGSVADMVENGGKMYIGGQFKQMGPATGSAVVLSRDHLTSECTSSLNVSGTVFTSVADGAGGWFIGGEFETVNGIARRNLARINSTCSQLSFDAQIVGGKVASLVRDGNRLFVGGSFTGIGGVGQPYLAAVDVETGAFVGPSNSNPSPSGQVTALAAHEGRLIVSSLGTHNSSPLGGAALFRSDTGAPYCSNPRSLVTNGAVLDAVPDGAGGWFIGGQFSAIGAFERKSLAHIDAACQVTSWRVDVTSVYSPVAQVRGLFLDAGRLYVWGDFSHVSGAIREGMAAIVATTGALNSWDPAPSSSVYSVDVSGDRIFVGGQFRNIGGQARECIASFNKSDFSITTWQPAVRAGSLCAKVNSLDVEGNLVYLVGQFSTVNGTTRNFFAAVDKDSGALDPLNPLFTPTNINNNWLRTVQVRGGKIYVTGWFEFVNGTARPGWAVLNASDGSLDSLNPSFDQFVGGFVSEGTSSYYWGNFTTAAGQARNGLAKIDEASGTVNAWDAAVLSGNANFVKVNGSQVFTGGYIYAVGGGGTAPRRMISLYDMNTYQPDPLVIDCDGSTPTLVVHNDWLFTGGEELSCNTVGGFSGFFGIDLNTGAVDETLPVINSGWINAAAAHSNTLYLGGEFSDLGGQTRIGAGAIDLVTKQVASWDPALNAGTNDTLYSIAADDAGKIWLGGDIQKSGGQARANFAVVDAVTGSPLAGVYTPPASGRPQTIVAFGAKVLVGGDFSSFGGVYRENLAAIDLATGRPDAWNPAVDQVVTALAFQGSRLYVGGRFSAVAGAARDKLAAFDLPGQTLSSWDPGTLATGGLGVAIHDLLANSTGVYAVGIFGFVNGFARGNMAAFAPDSGSLLPWAPTTNAAAPVHYIVDTGSDLVIAGNFGAVSGTARSGLAKVNASTGAVVAGWNPGGGLMLYNSTLLVAGSDLIVGRQNFSAIGGQTRGRLAILDLASGNAAAFNPDPNGYISAIWADGSSVLAAGSYQEIGGVYRNSYAMLDRATGAVTSWQTPIKGNPVKILQSGSHWFIACSQCAVNDRPLGGLVVVDITSGALIP